MENLMPQQMEPIIIEPPPGQPTTAPTTGDFLLYDTDFPEETNLRYRTIEGNEPLRVPHFAIGEIAHWVFGRKPQWLKDQIKRNAPLTCSSVPLIMRQVPGRGIGAERRLTLPDIERLAWALYERSLIDGLALQKASDIIAAVARQYGVGATAQNPERRA